MSYTISTDVCRVECPACGETNNLQDFQTDGCLTADTTFHCTQCEVALVIDSVDWEPTITVSAVVPAPTPGQPRRDEEEPR